MCNETYLYILRQKLLINHGFIVCDRYLRYYNFVYVLHKKKIVKMYDSRLK